MKPVIRNNALAAFACLLWATPFAFGKITLEYLPFRFYGSLAWLATVSASSTLNEVQVIRNSNITHYSLRITFMAKQKADVKIESCGLYTPLDKKGKDLPKLVRFTDEIPCELGVEFGYILHIRRGRGMKLTFQIDPPPFFKNGEIDLTVAEQSSLRDTAPFTGELYVRSNDWKFFLGDTTWEPIEDKAGDWRIRTWLDGDLVADRTLTLVSPNC